MTAPPAAPPSRIALSGWLRVAARVLAMIAWLAACVPLNLLWRARPRTRTAAHRNPWPRRFLSGIGRIAGLRVTIHGKRADGALPDSPVSLRSHTGEFILANHVSWLDIPALAGACGTAFVAHDGLAGHPLLRWLCEQNDTVFVARHDRAGVAQQVAQVREALHDTGALAIFPEGTTSDGTGLLPFKSSLLSAIDPVPAGIAVQPVLLDYGPEAAAIAWVGEEPGVDNFLRILARSRPVSLTVQFLPPLAGTALDGRKAMAAAARDAILGAMARTG